MVDGDAARREDFVMVRVRPSSNAFATLTLRENRHNRIHDRLFDREASHSSFGRLPSCDYSHHGAPPCTFVSATLRRICRTRPRINFLAKDRLSEHRSI